MGYGTLADLIVAFHTCYVAFVALGLVAILIGPSLNWRWVGNRWFRLAHFVMVGVVAVEAVAGWECPLTTWENQLRALSGQETSEVSFVGRLLRGALFWDFPPWVFDALYVVLALFVLSTFWLSPVRWRPGTSGRRTIEGLRP